MRSMRILLLVALTAAIGTATVASQAPASGIGNNVCANGVFTKSQFLDCYNHNASARALYNSLGITAAGIKGAKLGKACASEGLTSYGRNWTSGSVKVNPDGNKFYKRPLKSVMSGCASAWLVKTKNGTVKVLLFCGNPEVRKHKKVKHKPAPKKPKKPKAPATPVAAPPCVAGQYLVMTASGLACQTITQTQQAQVENNCKQITSNNSSQCVTLIKQYNIAINANCSEVHLVYSDESTTIVYKDNLGNEVTQNICTTQIVTPPELPPVPTDHLPQISCVTPAHLYPNGNVHLFCKAIDPDSDPIDPSINVSGAATGSNTIETNMYGDQSCPSGYTCFDTRIDAGPSAGNVFVTAFAIANGARSLPWFAMFPVKPDDFGSY